MPRQLYLVGCCLFWVLFAGCKPKDDQSVLVARETFAELRLVKGRALITDVGRRGRAPYPRERLGNGNKISLEPGALGYLLDDLGATWLLAGPTEAQIREHHLELSRGKVFVDTHGGPSITVGLSTGALEVSRGRTSITVTDEGTVEAYVLRGSLRHGTTRVSAGEMLLLTQGKPAETRKISSWVDWTSGLATADPEAQPAPFGLGTVGARDPGAQGKPRFSLVIQRLEVRVRIDHDYAQTEVDETFVNPSPDVVEGIFSFRVPNTGILHRFGVDREGLLVWGRPQEKRTAAEQYQNKVYAGSSEDPALLEWVQPGAYQARLYPIGPGATRRVVTRYGEWLARSGERGERRLYVYPMAATGAEGTLPRIEEMRIHIDCSRARASRIRAPLGSVVRGKQVILKAFDLLPQSDLALELFDQGQTEVMAYRARHALSTQDAPMDATAEFADKTSREESDYVLLPLTPPRLPPTEPGLDLAIVVDSSAATDSSALAVSRSLVDALLSALGSADRAALFAGDTALRPVLAESGQLVAVNPERKKAWLTELSQIPPGGATDLGALLAQAAERLDAKRRGAVIYVGDGRPSVGELLPKALHERLITLPTSARIFAVGVGTQINTALLSSLVRGAPIEVAQNGYEAAQVALRLLEAASAPAWQGSQVKVTGIDRLLPRSIPAVAAAEPALLIGRVAGSTMGGTIEISNGEAKRQLPLRVVNIDDDGDLRRRWGDARLADLVEQHTGRIAVVDLARRYGLVTPFTSLYVPSRQEAEREKGDVAAAPPEETEEERSSRLVRWRPWGVVGASLRSEGVPSLTSQKANPTELATQAEAKRDTSDQKEGGIGTRAKGEEGSMGNPQAESPRLHRELASANDSAERAALMKEAQGLGMIGLVNRDRASKRYSAPGAGDDPLSAAQPSPPAAAPPSADRANSADEASRRHTQVASASMRTSTKAGGMVASARAGTGTGAGFGSGVGRLGASRSIQKPKVTLGQPSGDGVQDTQPNTVTPAKLPESKPQAASSSGTATASPPLAQLSHELRPCSKASDLPLSERRKLWNERLQESSTAGQVVAVYHDAVHGCEAPGWYERQLLLYAMVDRLGDVRQQLELYRSFLSSPDYAAVIYRAILVRIQSAEALRQFQVALGIKTAPIELVRSVISGSTDTKLGIDLLRRLIAQWPNDLELPLRLLELYEDAEDYGGARSLSRSLRRRADATAHVRTMVGEFYWRCSERQTGAAKARDLEEARRTFGEIVEFAPEDPAARRQLGDLLRAHGWYAEAMRQYETLRDLVPDDPAVHLLIAAAAQGLGKTEEALRWTERAAATGAPDAKTELERAAEAFGVAYLAWAHDDATKAKRDADAQRLLIRGRKFAASSVGDQGIRFVLTWEHPELHPSLHGVVNSGALLGNPITQFGIAERTEDAKGDPRVEVRIDPEDAARVARLGAEAVLTAIVAAGTADQHTARAKMRFGEVKHPKHTLRFVYAAGALREEIL
ncbi:MAG TPA: VIT domain-containing protein [Polyangiaceae bacterium]|nr:VIT domain-containing protein [Polyangiaceae bacterium]